MPRIEFLESVAGPAAACDLPEGGALVDACDEAAAPIPFSCRSTSCGTCRVDVLEGSDLFEEAGDDEREVLAIFEDDPGKRRLACTARVRAGAGLIRVRATEDW
jgi:ferredoxin